MIDVTNKGYSFLIQMDNEDFLIEELEYSRGFTNGWDDLEGIK